MYSLAMERAKERLEAQAARTSVITMKILARMLLQNKPWRGREHRVKNLLAMISIDVLDARADNLAKRYRRAKNNQRLFK